MADRDDPAPARRPDYRLLPKPDRDALEEIRFAAVLNGGVSLAVWIGGVTCELDRLTRRRGTYDRILGVLRSRARVDVIGGTSAGGINGAFLALSQACPDVDLGGLRDLWAEQGSMTTLLHEPWTKNPASLLRGDEVFWPALRRAFAQMLPPTGDEVHYYDPLDRPVHLDITTTLLTPTCRTVVDWLGTPVQQPVRAGLFTFRRSGAPLRARDDLRATPMTQDSPAEHADDPLVVHTSVAVADRLALASRCTASFPIAFEPFFVPVGKAVGGTRGPADVDARPDMHGIADFDLSRWVIDGGILLNTPLRPVLEAIAAAPAELQTRRVLLLVVPDPAVQPERAFAPDPVGNRPQIPDVVSGIVQAWTGSTFEHELGLVERHNQQAVVGRGARVDLLGLLSLGELDGQAAALFPIYRALRIRRAAVHIANLVAAEAGRPLEQTTEEVVAALESQPSLPFVPKRWPAIVRGSTWGLAAAERLAVTVLDLLKRAVWEQPWASDDRTGPDLAPLRRPIEHLRHRFYDQQARLAQLRQDDTDHWRGVARSLLRSGRTVDDAVVAGLPDSNRAGAEVDEVVAALLDIGGRAAVQVGKAPVSAATRDDDARRTRLLAACFGDGLARRQLLALEVCYVCLVDQSQDQLVDQLAVELVTVGAGDAVHLAGISQTAPEDRVAGLRLGHFAAFLKQAWRVNDWTWGRLTAADRLVSTLLDPVRLRRLVQADCQEDEDAADAADRLLQTLLDRPAPTDRPWLVLREMLAAPKLPADGGHAALAPLVEELVTEIANAIIDQEAPALAVAVDIDQGAHDDTASRGARWQKQRG
ncbi:MAG: patatin-like protein [Nocardioidaceae bacterium]|nr:patatin-like protein [Nocardioidaceae bacterium]